MSKEFIFPTNLDPKGQDVHCVIHSSTEGDWDDPYNVDPRVKAATYTNALLFARMGGLPANVVLCHDASEEYAALLQPKKS